MALDRSPESHSHMGNQIPKFKIKGGNLTKIQSRIIHPDWVNLMTYSNKFDDDWVKNVASRVFTRFF